MAKKKRSLREACIDEAFRFLRDHPPRELSLREIARRLGVSHQAPYRHFQDREALMSAVSARAFAEFAEALDSTEETDNHHADLAALGEKYLNFAAQNPLHYRLMFGSGLDSFKMDPSVTEQALLAFNVLVRKVKRLRPDQPETDTILDSLSLWSTVHGLASIQQTGMLEVLGLTKQLAGKQSADILARLALNP